MTVEEAKAWVKDKANQDRVVARFFKDYPPTQNKMAFFMAGIPGVVKRSLLRIQSIRSSQSSYL